MKRSLLCVVVSAVAVAVAVTGLRGDVARAPELDQNFDNWKGLAAGIAKADKASLYEGVPHPLNEEAHYLEEIRTKKFLHFSGIPFYPDSTPLPAADADKLRKILTAEKTLVPYTGEKKCGGFHADWCVEWKVGADVYRCMLCFSCSEARLFGPTSSLQCDLAAARRSGRSRIS